MLDFVDVAYLLCVCAVFLFFLLIL